MKTRNGFVSNSSSTSFYITNKSKKQKTLVDFVKENQYLLDDFKNEYHWYKDDPRFTHENMIASAESQDIGFKPGKKQTCTFGDEDGTLIGHVYDYMLRCSGESKSFTWEFKEYNR